MSVGDIAKTEVVLRSQPGSVVATIQSIEVTQVTQGLTGAPGDTLPGSGDASYIHEQNTPSDEWTIDHNLAKYPSVTIVDSANDEVGGEVRYIDANRVVVSFSAAFVGRAFIN